MFTSPWKPAVNLLVGKCVGGVSCVSKMFKIGRVSRPAAMAAAESALRPEVTLRSRRERAATRGDT